MAHTLSHFLSPQSTHLPASAHSTPLFHLADLLVDSFFCASEHGPPISFVGGLAACFDLDVCMVSRRGGFVDFLGIM